MSKWQKGSSSMFPALLLKGFLKSNISSQEVVNQNNRLIRSMRKVRESHPVCYLLGGSKRNGS